MNTDIILSSRRKILDRFFAKMNDRQREAIYHTEGPVLILAGAGSGKTTVLVNRIACLIQFGRGQTDSFERPLSEQEAALLIAAADGTAPIDDTVASLCAVDPCPGWRILAITFTNKAAGELKDRLAAMLGDEGTNVDAGTFHSFCARLLRREGAALGYSSHFIIYDTDDSRRLIKQCMSELDIDERTLGHKAILGEISRAKNSLTEPTQETADPRMRMIARCYARYQQRLLEADAMDFDDLLVNIVRLFEKYPDVLEKYRHRYRYIMVDEYQDTNHAQYRLISLLTGKDGNLCVVGDDDQSIYKFRGATIENILSFEQEFPRSHVIRLEQNYRSTQTILDAANAVIAKNVGRKGKTLWTENGTGEKITSRQLENEDDEGRFIADTVLDGIADGRRYRDFAVLYRMNAQSNAIERSFVKSGIPYRVIGGHRFSDTQEVRDAHAYLRVIQNPSDRVALQRIINCPRRGIGEATVSEAERIADGLGIPLYEVLQQAENYPTLSRAAGKLRAFTDMIDRLRETEGTVSLHLLYKTMLTATGYLDMWVQAGDAEQGRVDNLHELASSIMNYEQNCEEDETTLSGYLEEAALVSDVDNYDASADAVILMTIHAAKGLEFPTVFLPGFEDGIFPGIQSIYQPEELEEDRRLCYVAITRAKKQLYLLRAASRMLFGSTTRNRPSRFLEDIPKELLNEPVPVHSFTFTRAASTADRFSPSSSAPKKVVPSFSAARSASVPTASAPAGGWTAGVRVSHKVFGEGVIRAVTPMGNDTLLTVEFTRVGTKKIMANYAKLTVL